MRNRHDRSVPSASVADAILDEVVFRTAHQLFAACLLKAGSAFDMACRGLRGERLRGRSRSLRRGHDRDSRGTTRRRRTGRTHTQGYEAAEARSHLQIETHV